jgi:hypothetical protein
MQGELAQTADKGRFLPHPAPPRHSIRECFGRDGVGLRTIFYRNTRTHIADSTTWEVE